MNHRLASQSLPSAATTVAPVVVPQNSRVAVLAAADPDNADLACEALLKLGRDATPDNILVFWTSPGPGARASASREGPAPPSVSERIDTTAEAARRSLIRHGLNAAVVAGVCEADGLGKLVDDAGVEWIVVPRPRPGGTPAGSEWFELWQSLRDVAHPVLLV